MSSKTPSDNCPSPQPTRLSLEEELRTLEFPQVCGYLRGFFNGASASMDAAQTYIRHRFHNKNNTQEEESIIQELIPQKVEALGNCLTKLEYELEWFRVTLEHYNKRVAPYPFFLSEDDSSVKAEVAQMVKGYIKMSRDVRTVQVFANDEIARLLGC